MCRGNLHFLRSCVAIFAPLGFAILFMLHSPADAHDLMSSVTNTYYTNNIPLSLLTEVKNRFPTFLMKGTGNRKLQDFDELNELLSSVTLVLPSIEPIDAGIFFFAQATLAVDSIICSDISIQDLQVSHQRFSDTQVAIDISIVGLAFDCAIDWTLDWLLDENGSATVNTTNNAVDMQFLFTSSNFDVEPPTAVTQSDCSSQIVFDDIDVSGGAVSWLVNAFEGLMRSPIQNVLEGFICPEDPVDDLFGPLLTNLIMTLDQRFEPFQQAIPDELNDPLYPENNLVAPPGIDFIGFSSFTMVQTGLAYVNSLLGGTVDDPNSPDGSGRDIAINKFLRDNLLDENRAWILNGTMFGTLYEGEDILTQTTISVASVNIYGLDTLVEFVPIQSIGEYTMATNLNWKEMDLEIILNVEIRPSNGNNSVINGGQGTVIETIVIQMGLRDIDIDFAAMVAVSGGNVTAIPFGSLKDVNILLSCLSESIHGIEVSNMGLSIGDVVPPTLKGFISPGIDKIVSSLSLAVFEMYEGFLLDIMPYIFQVSIRQLVNNAIEEVIDGSERCDYESSSSSEIINLPDLILPAMDAVHVGGSGTLPYGRILPLVFGTIINEVRTGMIDGDVDVNDFIRIATLGQSGAPGTLYFDNLVDLNFDFALGASKLVFQLKVYETSIANLDTFGIPFDLLNATAPQIVDNVAAIGVGEDPVRVKTNLMFAIEVPGSEILRNDLEISVGMQNLVLYFSLFISIVEERMMNLSFEDLANPNCLMSTISAPSMNENGAPLDNMRSMFFEELTLVGRDIDLNIKCTSCSSDVEGIVKLFGIAAPLLNLSGTINSLLESLTNVIGGDGSVVNIERYLTSSPYHCPSNKAYDPSYVNPKYSTSALKDFSTVPEPANNFIRNFLCVLGIIFVLVLAFLLWVKRQKKRRLESWAKSMTERQAILYKSRQRSDQLQDEKLNAETTSMFTSTAIPLFVRIVIPIVIVSNVGLFLSGHLSLGAQVDLTLDIVGERMSLSRIFDFSLAGSIKDMWQKGAKELAVFIVIFSGIWPYTKQSVTFFLWFSPTRWMSVRKRENTLMWLDTLGKWSFVDIFVLLMSLVGFSISVKSPEIALLPIELYGVNILVVPKWGLYANMIAQLLSQISSHFIIYYHRKIATDCLEDVTATSDGDTSGSIALCKYTFHDDNDDRESVRKGVNVALIVWVALVVSMFLCGCILHVFSIESFGMIGVAIKAGTNAEDAIERFSFFDVVNLVVVQASYSGVTADYVGLMALAIIFVWTVFIAPLLQLSLLMYRWFVPMDRKGRHRNFVAIETIMAWQYSEVFIISIVVASWQLGSISEYMVNDYCGDLEGFFVSAVSSGVLDELDGQCFRAEASINMGAWFLCAGILGIAMLTHFVGKAARQQEEEDEWRERSRNLPQDIRTENEKEVIEIVLSSTRFTDCYRWLLWTENLNVIENRV